MIILTSRTCQPCSVLKAMYQNDERVKFIDITNEEGTKLSDKYGVRAVPTLIDKGAVINGAPSIMRYLKEEENA